MKTLLAIACMFIMSVSQSQSTVRYKRPVIYGGIGAGLDYGGLGFKFEYMPVKSIGLFAGGGYNFNRLGGNGGVSWKILPKENLTPMLMGMYGYNAVLKVKSPYYGASFAETYYGFSVGGGFEYTVGRNRNKLSLAVVVPFRGSDFTEQYDAYKAAGYTFTPDVSKVLISVGFNIAGYGR